MTTSNGISKDAVKMLVRLERGLDKALVAVRKAQDGKKFGQNEGNALLNKVETLCNFSELDDFCFSCNEVK
jgi:hypothetical protein